MKWFKELPPIRTGFDLDLSALTIADLNLMVFCVRNSLYGFRDDLEDLMACTDRSEATKIRIKKMTIQIHEIECVLNKISPLARLV